MSTTFLLITPKCMIFQLESYNSQIGFTVFEHIYVENESESDNKIDKK